MSLPWFRMYAKFATDAKVQSMDETLQRRFVMFLCLQCSGEYESLEDEDLASAMRITLDELTRTKEIFRRKGFIDTNGEIRNWNRLQFKSDSSTERVREHRERQRNGNETLQERPQIQTQITDTDSEKRKGSTSASPPAPKLVEQVFEHWQREWNHPDAKLDAKRRKRIETRLKDFTVEQLRDAISGFKHSPWHTGTDPKSNGTVYDGLQTLLRDTAQVEEGLRLFAHPPRPPPKVDQLSPVERVLRANGVNRDERVVAEQFGSGGADVGDAGGDVRKPAYAGFRRIGS